MYDVFVLNQIAKPPTAEKLQSDKHLEYYIASTASA
jgi:hypothetical protein